MKKFIKLYIGNYLFWFLLLISPSAYSQQSLSHSQYIFNLGVINPTWYLSDNSGSLHGVVHKQWTGIDDAPSTFILNGHIPLQNIQSAIGLNLSYDRFGPENFANIDVFFAKSIQLSASEKYLSGSLIMDINRFEGQYSKLDFNDPVFSNDVLETTVNIGLGIMFYEPERFFVGFSVPHLSMSDLGISSHAKEYNFNATYYLMAGYLAKINDLFKIKSVVLATQTKGSPTKMDASTILYIQDALGLGLNYGSNKRIGAHLSVFASNKLRLSYNYQFNTESYIKSIMGNSTHEVGLNYRFGESVVKRLL